MQSDPEKRKTNAVHSRQTGRVFKQPSRMSRTAILVECAMMAALAFILSVIPFFHMPLGGSITLFSTLPIVVVSFRHGAKWGMSTAAVYGIIQALQGANNVAAAGGFGAMVLCVLLDYFLSYSSVGLSGPIAGMIIRRKAKPVAGIAVGIASTGLMRLACSFISGMLIWGAWAPEGVAVWKYSLTYNAGWCLPDVAIVLVAALALSRVTGADIIPVGKART